MRIKDFYVLDSKQSDECIDSTMMCVFLISVITVGAVKMI